MVGALNFRRLLALVESCLRLSHPDSDSEVGELNKPFSRVMQWAPIDFNRLDFFGQKNIPRTYQLNTLKAEQDQNKEGREHQEKQRKNGFCLKISQFHLYYWG